VLFAGAAGAVPISTTDVTTFTDSGTAYPGDLVSSGGSSVQQLETEGDHVSWMHRFDLGSGPTRLLDSTLDLYFSENDRDYSYSYRTRDCQHIGWGRYDCHYDYVYVPGNPEYGLLSLEDSGEQSLGEIDSHRRLLDLSLEALADGLFGLTLTSTGGDFRLDRSELTVNHDPMSAVEVPAAPPFVLIAWGLIGLGAVGRKRRYSR
jgi:hypothetical protein